MSSSIALYDIDAADQSIGAWLKDGSGSSINSTGGALHISDAGGSLTVDAVDLDIRNLAAATDLVSAWLKDGAGNSINSTGNALHISDAGGSLTVDAVDLDIRNLAFATDKVDVSGSSITTIAEVNDTVSEDAITVGATAVELIATAPVANRRQVLVQNVGGASVWLGSSAVLTTTGVELIKQASVLVDASQGLYAIAAGAGRLLRIMELGLGA